MIRTIGFLCFLLFLLAGCASSDPRNVGDAAPIGPLADDYQDRVKADLSRSLADPAGAIYTFGAAPSIVNLGKRRAGVRYAWYVCGTVNAKDLAGGNRLTLLSNVVAYVCRLSRKETRRHVHLSHREGVRRAARSTGGGPPPACPPHAWPQRPHCAVSPISRPLLRCARIPGRLRPLTRNFVSRRLPIGPIR